MTSVSGPGSTGSTGGTGSTDSTDSTDSMGSTDSTGSSAGEVKTLPFVVTLVVSVATVFVCGEFFGFPWWLRLITVVGVGLALEAANQAVGRARARKRAL
ncbi:hypothetical protein [Streptomyces badius]|uniref:Uncharacterized protein n=1 Tax=Streptomyces badius TaxID=1941 RepID=A0ABQ2SYU8_STRBA|nr:hypothetical protein [Streptomyces badius]GGS42461.1 hypothetical protein GCM10010253_15680 [Streptomyces badius]